MKNSKEIFRDLQQQLTLREDRDEIQSILYLVIESVLGLSRADIFSEKPIVVNELASKKLTDIIRRINTHEPIQYILGTAYFYGRRFNVSLDVLIPRPETELLVEEVLKEIDPFTPGKILDIGTGSGCIAITLAKELPEKNVLAIDISAGALKTAKENAHQLTAAVEFHMLNILSEEIPFHNLAAIVSNPPYVTLSEKIEIKKNVLEYEPHLALFVPNYDPLLFYKAIALKGFSALNSTGKVFTEINAQFGIEVSQVFKNAGFRNARVIKDLQGRDRIVVAEK